MRIENRKAKYLYNIIETYTAGVVLLGSEVKSIRQGNVSLSNSYCEIIGGEIFVVDMHISNYECSREKFDPKRQRKLLLKKTEINKLIGKISEKGYTIVPLSLYFNNRGIVKIEIALCKGKKKYEKKEKIKKREINREIKKYL